MVISRGARGDAASIYVGRWFPAALTRHLAGEGMPIEIIDISDDYEEIDWDLLRGESEQVSVGPVVK